MSGKWGGKGIDICFEKANNTEKTWKWETTELLINSLTIAKKLEAKMC